MNMKTQFDKIYVLSLITNKERQEFIKYQFDELQLDVEFIYGIDFYNIKYNAQNEEIKYPYIFKDRLYDYGPESKNFGCALTHYQAVLQAYELGYNNVLILEDDVCFIKNKNLIEYYLNNIPNNADFITFDPRFCSLDEQTLFINHYLKNNIQNNWFKINNNVKMIGGMMYGLMNRKTMKLYLDNQRQSFNMSDHVNNIFDNPIINRYVSTKCICTDFFNITCDFNINSICYTNIYSKLNKLSKDNFYNAPSNCSFFTRLN